MEVFKKKTYKSIPTIAEIVEEKGKQVAKWTGRQGKTYKFPVEKTKDGDRIVIVSKNYVARYRNESGQMVEKSMGCRDKQNAQRVLQSWLDRVEKIKTGILTAEELKVSERLHTPIDEVLQAYKVYLETTDGDKHVGETINRIHVLCRDCRFVVLNNINPQDLNGWMVEQAKIGKRGASTRNHCRKALATFLNWAVENDWMMRNPITKRNVPTANTEVDVRRKRRALSKDEINRLLEITKNRPLIEAMTIRTGKRKGERHANIRVETRQKRELLGLERMTIYGMMIYTGLRKKELKSLRIGQLFLNETPPLLHLIAKDTKNKQGVGQPLHSHLVSLLKKWIDAKTVAKGVSELAPEEPLFYVPNALYKILNRDLRLAGIEKKDFLGQSIDVHALRHTHATQLALAGVSPKVAQKSMRHSKIGLTMDVYTHLEREDLAEGIEKLPKFGE